MKIGVAIGIIIAILLLIGISVYYVSRQAAPAPEAGQPSAPPAPAPSPSPSSTPSPSAETTNIQIINAFNPNTVTIKKGATVTWTNGDTVPHKIADDSNAYSSGTLANGDTFSHTFNTAGTFAYHCSIHPAMKGKIIVTD